MTDRNKLKPRRSYTANSVPLVADLEENEMAVNWTDGKVFVRRNNAIITLTMGGSGGGGSGSITAYANLAAFPATGDETTLYISKATDRAYRYDTTEAAYIEVGPLGGGGGSGGTVTIPASGDPLWASVSLLLKFDGSLLDSSANGFPVTAGGNAAVTTSQSKFGIGSCVFDGDGDYLSVANNSAFAFGTGDYTVELWHRSSVASEQTGIFAICDVPGGFAFGLEYGNLIVGRRSTSPDISYAHTPTQNTWTHYAACRINGTLRAFINGTQVASVSDSTNHTIDGPLVIGGIVAAPSYSVSGHIDELRITKGAARYVATFTPPTQTFPAFGQAAQTISVVYA